MSADKRKIVVVLGVGRSGTSLTMNIAHRLGLEVSENLIPENKTNLKGAWEDAEILEISREILKYYNRDTWNLGYLPMPTGWLEGKFIRKQIKCLKNILQDRLEATSGKIWGFKEPVTAKLLPMWRLIFEDLEVEPIYLLSLRSPVKVIQSFKIAYNAVEGLTELVWISRYYDAIKYTNGDFVVIDFDLWFSKPKYQAKKLLDTLFLEVDDDVIDSVLSDVIDKTINKVNDTESRINSHISAELYELLSQYDKCNQERDDLFLLNKKVEDYFSIFEKTAVSVDFVGSKLHKVRRDIELCDKKYLDEKSSKEALELKLINKEEQLQNKINLITLKNNEINLLEKKYRKLKTSGTLRLGQILILAVKKPGLNTLILPYNLMKLFYMSLVKKRTFEK